MTSRLSTDMLARLTPLLGSLARLVAGGSQLSDAQLHTLLIGADLESEPAALEELRRWGRLLRALREQPSEENRQATLEALLLRGLPEASVLLAVETVADQPQTTVPSPSAPQPRRLAASVASLDLGTLPSGQPAAGEFEVQGGPGQIVVESDQVRVTPQQFGAGATRVRVEVRPLAGGVLWTTLRLVTAGETLEVPVLAQWQEAPVPPITPIPSGVLTVAPDGSGDFRSVEEAIQKVQPGATLYLEAGTHRLGRSLQIGKALSLIGEGMEVTHLVYDGEGPVVQYSGEGTFSAGDIAFVHEGTRWGNAVWVDNGEVSFHHCRFTGGVWDEANQRGGDGLSLSGTVRGRVEACQATGNRLMGIRVAEQAQPTLEGNTCQGNKDCGIVYFGTAAGTARQNTCQDNEVHGIYVAEQAQPTLEGNTCQGNKGNGIYVEATARPTLKDNRCWGNKERDVHDRRR